MELKASPGKSYPLGCTIMPDGVNFVVYAKRADYLELLLFDNEDSDAPSAVYKLSAEENLTSNYWHVFIAGCKANQHYGWRAYGPYEPEQGLLYDAHKILIDPYARGVVGWKNYSRDAAMVPGDNCANALKSVVLDTSLYDWEHDRPPAIPFSETIIYEMHPAGFTLNPNSGLREDIRGTFAGIIEQIPYLKSLGVTTVELMPVHTFDKFDAPIGRTNYWGYSPINFFSPHMAYSSKRTAIEAADEFRDMVKAFHKNKIEVILDVVFNHTGEGGAAGPILSFKGLDNLTYYTLDENDFSYQDFSGCGNSLRSEHPIVGQLILDSLRYWVSEMHVDGFRFDLASVLSRDLFGKPAERPPVLWAIESDPILASSKLILEAWDPAGLYQVGWYVRRSNRFAEWNGPFRDDVRKFVRGDSNSVYSLSQRISGSKDIYGKSDWDPARSIHFITCHDGFTLNDVVSYNQKHNEANGEDNRDGSNENFSWNCGVEGPTDDEEVEALRIQQIKNMLTILFLAPGTPMLSMGDELRRTARGNNNAYCQNSELSWFDWSQRSTNRETFLFTRNLIALRKMLGLYKKNYLWQESDGDGRHARGDNPKSVSGRYARAASDNVSSAGGARAQGSGANAADGEHAQTGPNFNSVDSEPMTLLKWHGVKLDHPDVYPQSHSLAMELKDTRNFEHLYAAFNAYWEPLEFELPHPLKGDTWQKVVDTSMLNLNEIRHSDAMIVSTSKLVVQARSTIVLVNSNTLIADGTKLVKAGASISRPDMKITWTAPKPDFD